MTDELQVRQITADERDRAIAVGNESFGFGPDFGRDWPFLWHDGRIDNTWACFIGGKMAGIVGSYPMEVTMGGVKFRSACVGTVSTLPAYRGRGVMSAILRAVTADMDSGIYDFTWLGGDRQRYGRYGWAFGVAKLCYRTNAKCLPAPPDESTVRPLDMARDGDMIWQFTQEMPYGIGFTREEFDMLMSIRNVGGVVSDDAWVIYRGPDARPYGMLADGPTDSVASLFAHLSQRAIADGDEAGTIGFETGPCDCPMTRMAMKHYSTMDAQQVGGFRMCDMAGYFRRAREAVQPTVIGGSDELSLRNTDTGQAVRIVCKKGKLSVDEKPGPDVREMTTTQISEVVFSMLPLDVALPGLATNSPLRALLRMPVYLPFGFYAM